MFNSQAFENSRPDGIGVLEIVPPEGTGDSPRDDEPRHFVPLKRSELKGEVLGPLAALRLVQVFGFAKEQGDKVIEALYRFPLPGDAAVTGVWVRFGDVDIKAKLKERAQAEQDYDAARQEGRQAALVTRESPDVFTLRLAGIQPGQDVTVETRYVQLARAEAGGWSLRVPLTTSPRYVRGDESSSRHAQGQPLALLRDPGHRFALDLSVQGADQVSSSTHLLKVTREGERRRVWLKDGEVVPDRDYVLAWKPQTADQRALQVWLHGDGSGLSYFLALIAPAAAHDRGQGVPREVVLLVDHSGSMEGAKWQAADWAVERFLSDLGPRDRFALGFFHNQTFWLAKKTGPATPEAIAEAIEFVKSHRDSGGTELGVALEQALGIEHAKGDFARHLLIITDAEVSDSGRILRLVSAPASAKSQAAADWRRVSLLCIDAAPNSLLALQLAERGGGVARFLTSQPEEEDIATALDEVLADWAEPIIAGLRLDCDGLTVEASKSGLPGRATIESSVDVGDLPAGRPIWICGRLPSDANKRTRIAFQLRTARNQEIATCTATIDTSAEILPALKALFGAQRVRALEYLMHSGLAGDELREQLELLGYDPQALAGSQPATVYFENAHDDLEASLKSLLVRESLEYGLACSETAFVATRTQPGKPVEESIVVANALPAGWSERFIGGMGGFKGGATVFCMAPAAPVMRKMAAPTRSARSSVNMMFAKQVLAAAGPDRQAVVVFCAVPAFLNSEATLFDSTLNSNLLPDETTIDEVRIRLLAGTPASIDPGLCLLIFVDDSASPRARVKLADIVRHGGNRPLNLLKRAGQLVRLVLVDPANAWKASVPEMEVTLSCR